MFKIGHIEKEKALLLAPMEDVTDLSFRLICRELGADVVYTEFVNSEGLIRDNKNTHKKLRVEDQERPVAIQIYGSNIDAMVEAAKIAENAKPDFIDINAGCWVRKVAGCGAGAGLLKDPKYLAEIVYQIVKAVSLPVTVKTRLGWDQNSIEILDVAQRIEEAGASALTLHCRTRSQGNKGEVDWTWINKVKEVVSFPVAVNGNILTPEDAKRAFEETNADAVMIARGAIGNPWIFLETKELLEQGSVITKIDEELKIKTCLKHLQLAMEVKGDRRGIIEHRKFYTGYLKGMHNASRVRDAIMHLNEYNEIEDLLYKFSEELKSLSLP